MICSEKPHQHNHGIVNFIPFILMEEPTTLVPAIASEQKSKGWWRTFVIFLGYLNLRSDKETLCQVGLAPSLATLSLVY